MEENNLVAFDNTKNEMIAFTRERKLKVKKRIAEAKVMVCGDTMSFNTKVTRLLGVYLDTGPQFRSHKNLALEKAKTVEDKV